MAPPAARVLALAGGYARARLLFAATALGIPDIVSRPTTAGEIARRLKADAPAVARLLRGLVGIGVLAPASRRRFAPTPCSRCLRRDAPGPARTLVLLSGSETHWRSWGEILHTVRTGRPAFERVFRMPYFRYLDRAPEARALFDAAMADYSAEVAGEVADGFDFSDVRTVVDVGGGRGGLLLPLLSANPRMAGVLFDGPRALRAARKGVAAVGIAGRCTLVAGDFFRSVPRGGDVYLLRNVLLDWDDVRALRILRSCRRAMAKGSVLLVAEMVCPPENRPWAGTILDLDLLLLTGGRTRTRAEHRSLCRAARLRVRRFVETPSGTTLIEAVPL